MNGLPVHLAAVLGHELRNPLAAAMTGASLLRELLDTGDPRLPTVAGVLRDLGRIDRLRTSWLDFARTGQLRREPVDLAALLAEFAGAAVTVTVVAADSSVAGDGNLLRRAFANLIENALAAGAHGVQIRLEARGGGLLRVQIDDDGPGIPKDQAADLFTAGVSHRGSTGLGLAIVQTTITAHGGFVRCEPRPRGGRFVIELAALAAPAPVHATMA